MNDDKSTSDIKNKIRCKVVIIGAGMFIKIFHNYCFCLCNIDFFNSIFQNQNNNFLGAFILIIYVVFILE